MGISGPKPRTFNEVLAVILESSYYNPDTGCYLWKGRTAGEGYGVICWQGKQVYIHRLIYTHIAEEEPRILRHTCDIPNCWNPVHLLNGTHADNIADKVAKRRHYSNNVHCNAKLTVSQVLAIRDSDLSPVKLAVQYGISRSVIHSILKRETWKHV